MSNNLLDVDNWTWMDGCDDLSNFINGDIVMSLLDDMQGDQLSDDDDERLTSVIRSLEAEIDQGQSRPTFNNIEVPVHGHDYFQGKPERNYNGENLHSLDIVNQCWSEDFVEPNDLDLSWMEIEMASSYLSDDMNNLSHMNNNYGQNYKVVGGICDFSGTVCFEENDYNSFWQEQNVV